MALFDEKLNLQKYSAIISSQIFEPYFRLIFSSQISSNILVLETLNGEELVSYVDSGADNSFGDEPIGDRPTFLLTVRSPEERIASAWLESPIEPPGFETQNSRKRFPLYTNPSMDSTGPSGTE